MIYAIKHIMVILNFKNNDCNHRSGKLKLVSSFKDIIKPIISMTMKNSKNEETVSLRLKIQNMIYNKSKKWKI